jgi:hypothetical protein
MFPKKVADKYSKYKFEFRHLTILVSILIVFQIALSIVQKSSLNNFLNNNQEWYQRHSAERLGLVTSTSLELLVENMFINKGLSALHERKLAASFNVVFKQQLLQKDVKEICLILTKDKKTYIIDDGQQLYNFFSNNIDSSNADNRNHREAMRLYSQIGENLKKSEVLYSSLTDKKTFNIFVPFVPDGEYTGVMYMKITPDFSLITNEISYDFDKVAIIYSTLIVFGLIAIYYVSSKAVNERNAAQEQLYKEHEENLMKQIRHEKESLFTKRIYHTHHKAEKIMGFIKDDVRQMNGENIETMKSRVVTYSNFISRIIYDMKWYDQPINTIINPIFNCDINGVIDFIVKHLFLRISSRNDMFDIVLELDKNLPTVHVNEFVVWEILEPLIQNSIDHGGKRHIIIKIATLYDEISRHSQIIITDTGNGITEDLLTVGEKGIKKLFNENESTKKLDGANSGYGCYIAYQMAVERCGWKINADNQPSGGARFIINIPN